MAFDTEGEGGGVSGGLGGKRLFNKTLVNGYLIISEELGASNTRLLRLLLWIGWCIFLGEVLDRCVILDFCGNSC